MTKWLFTAVIVLVALVIASSQQYRKACRELERAEANIKAYNEELSTEKSSNVAYQFTIDELKNYQDSIVRELDAVRKELKIKDSKLKSLYYVASDFTRVDTVVLQDTIFKEPSLKIDTVIGDEWYSTKVHLQYPSIIAVEPSLKSQKYVVISTKRETVKPRKKFFLLRWFQKKHTVVKVDIKENNPYIKEQYSKYIEIVK